MSTEGGAALHLSIGEVLAFLQEEFPDVTISKIRFLESQGLIQPDRTASGYRKFYESDIERLQWILRQQRDHFLPLKVIRKMLDEGVDKFDPGGGAQPTLWTPTEDEEPAEATAEPSTIGNGPPRSPAHPAVASAAGGAGAGPGDGGPRPSRPAALPTAPASSSPSEVEATAGATPTDEPPGAEPTPAAAGSEGGGGEAPSAAAGAPASGGGRRSGSRPVRTPAERSAGARSGTAGRRADAPAPSSKPHETPADVVAALQEDPRTSRAARERGAAEHAPATSGRRARPSGPPVDPDTELTAAELCRDSGIDEALLDGLERFGLVAGQVRGGERVYGPDAVRVARLAARYGELGVEPRHLRMYLVSVEREAGFVEQLAVPLLKQRNPQARGQASELATELSDLGAELHRILLQRELGPDLLP